MMWTYWHECYYANSVNAAAQQNAQPSQYGYSDSYNNRAQSIGAYWQHNRRREMTEDDLGLAVTHGLTPADWAALYPMSFTMGRWTDAPFSFWLGADA